MKGELGQKKFALTLGSFAALGHLAWSILVVTGAAQGLMDWIYGLHFLNNPFRVGSFDLIKAVTLIIVAFIVGYVVGWIFAVIWNAMHKK